MTLLASAPFSFNCPTGAPGVGTTVAVSGLTDVLSAAAFNVKFVKLWCVGLTDADDDQTSSSLHARLSIGFFNDALEQYVEAGQQIDGASPTQCDGMQRNDACVLNIASGGATYAALTLDSVGLGTFQLHSSGTAAFPLGVRVFGIAFGGDIESKFGVMTIGSGSGAETIAAAFPWDPDTLFFTGIPQSMNVAYTTGQSLQLGVVTKAPDGALDQWVWAQSTRDNTTANGTGHRYLRAGQASFLKGATATTTNQRFSVTTLAADLEISKPAAFGSAWTQPYIAVRGLVAKCGTLSTTNVGATISLPFDPVALMIVSHGTTQQADNVVNTAAATMQMGWCSSATNERCQTFQSVNGSQFVTIGMSSTRIGVQLEGSATYTQGSDMQIGTLGAGAFAYTMPDGAGAAYFLGWLAFGSAGAVVTGTRSYAYVIG